MHAAPVFADRIVGARHEEHRQAVRNARGEPAALGIGRKLRQRAVRAHREHLAGQGVCQIGIDNVRVGRDPVGIGAGVPHRAGERAGPERMGELAVTALTVQACHHAAEKPPRPRHDEGLLTGSADDGGAHPERVACEVHTRDEAAHGMAEQHIGHLYAQPPDGLHAKRLHIVHENVLAVAQRHVPQVVCTGSGAPVPHMVMRAHREALSAEELDKRQVASRVLRHAVHDLNECARAAAAVQLPLVRLPQPRAHGRRAVGTRI